MDFQCFAWSAADKFFKNASWILFSATSHHSWNDHPSLKLYRRYSHLRGVWVGKRDIRTAIFITCVNYSSCSFPVFLLNQNVEPLSTKLCSVEKPIPFPQHFFFPGKWICCVWKCCLAFLPKGNGLPLENFIRLCESRRPYTPRNSGL